MEAEERQRRILDADYSQVDLAGYVQELRHLTQEERFALLRVLQQFPVLFGIKPACTRPVADIRIRGTNPSHTSPLKIVDYIPGEATIQSPIPADEIKVVYVPQERVAQTKLLLGDTSISVQSFEHLYHGDSSQID